MRFLSQYMVRKKFIKLIERQSKVEVIRILLKWKKLLWFDHLQMQGDRRVKQVRKDGERYNGFTKETSR